MTKNKTLLTCQLIFIIALLNSIYTASVGWYAPITDQHSFRQAQTALAGFWLMKGGPFFQYETPLLGAPWSVPMELPVYQWIFAKISILTGMGLEQSARFVSRFFFYAMLWPLFLLFRYFRFKKEGIYIGLSILLASPLYLYWSRTVLIESMATFLGLGFFAYSLLTICEEKLHYKNLINACLFGIFAGTVKSTTAFMFFVLVGVAFLYFYFSKKILLEKKRKIAIEFFCILIIPSITAIAWILYSDYLKTLNPLANFLTSENLKTWNFGTWKQRTSFDIWYMFFRKTFHGSIGHRTTWILSLLALPFINKTHRRLALLSQLCFFIVPMVFTNLHIAHDYYWMANGIFLIIYLAFVLDGMYSSDKKILRQAALALSIIAIALSFRQFYKYNYYWQKNIDTGHVDLAKPVSEIVPENDAIIIVGAEWYPLIPYGAQRRSIMLRKEVKIGGDQLNLSLKNLKDDGKEVKAILQCHYSTWKDVAPLQYYFKIDPKPYYSGSCAVYKVMGTI